MKNHYSPANQPWVWLLREASLIVLLALVAYVVSVAPLPVTARVVLFIGSITAAIYLSLRTITEILVSGACRFMQNFGAGLGSVVASVRDAWRSA